MTTIGHTEEHFVHSPSAERVYQALLAASTDNRVVHEFAIRIAKKVRRYEAGYMRKGPVGSFLLFVPRQVSANYLLEVLAEAWLEGKPWDESRAFFQIDCSRLTVFNPMVQLELRGGRIGFGGDAATVVPMLGRINEPHIAIRGGDFLRNIDSWWGYFRPARVKREGLLLNRGVYDDVRENLRLLIEAERRKYEEELREEAGFRSVVVFDDLSYITHPEVFRVMQNIIEKGSELVWPNETVDFSRSLVIAVVYDDINEGWRNHVGIGKTKERAAPSVAPVHTYLKEIPQLAGLDHLIGRKNLFALQDHSFEDQLVQITWRMQDMQRRFQEAGISIDWSEEFRQGLTGATFDADLKAYTDGCMTDELDEHVIDHVVTHLNVGELRHGAKLRFEVASKDEQGGFRTNCIIKEAGAGAILTAADIRRVWEGKEKRGLSQDEAIALVEGDARIARLNDEAKKLLKPGS